MKKILSCIILGAMLSACATGSAIVTGQKRDPIDVSKVRVVLRAPSSAQVIGIVKARSLGGMSDQAKQDYAVKELKAQAAKLGANAELLLKSGDQVTTGGTYVANGYGGGTIVPYESHQAVLSAKALYIPPKNE